MPLERPGTSLGQLDGPLPAQPGVADDTPLATGDLPGEAGSARRGVSSMYGMTSVCCDQVPAGVLKRPQPQPVWPVPA